MILKFSRADSGWTFIDQITTAMVDRNPLQTADDHYVCAVITTIGKDAELNPFYFKKEDAVYLLNDDGKTIECLN